MRNVPELTLNDSGSGISWAWWRGSPGLNRREYLFEGWWDLLQGGDRDSVMLSEYPTRRAADDAAARAFTELPPKRRSQLLAGRQGAVRDGLPGATRHGNTLLPNIDLGDGTY